MSEHERRVEKFRRVIRHECDTKGLKLFQLTNLHIAKVLQELATESMKQCLDDPRNVPQIRKMIGDAAQEIYDEIAPL